MKVLSYQVVLDEPVLASSLDGDPNDAESYPYLPGSLLRGALIRRYRQSPGTRLDATDDVFRRLFLDGACRFLNAYPVIDGCRGLPVPRAWHLKKGDEVEAGANIQDFAISDELQDNEQYRLLPRPFCLPDADNERATALAPDKQLQVHTQRDPEKGRATEAEGAVFRYAALAEGQRFAAAILCDHDTDAATLQALLSGELLLGGSRTGGYGRARIDGMREADTDWREAGTDYEEELDDDILTITLLSPALLRADHGGYAVSPQVITKALNTRLESSDITLPEIPDKDKTFLAAEPVGGFNRTWNLPLTQALACAAGSVLVYRGIRLPDTARRQLEDFGIGERRAEGFGRVAVNWVGQEQWTVHVPPVPPAETAPVTIESEAGKRLAKIVQERRLRRKLDEQVLIRSQFFKKNMKLPAQPDKTQLARLRSRIKAELLKAEPDLNSVTEFCSEVESRSSARSKWDRMRMSDGRTLLEWLRDRCGETQPQQWRQLLGLSIGNEQIVSTIGGVAASIDDAALRREYLLRLFDALLARIMKQGGND